MEEQTTTNAPADAGGSDATTIQGVQVDDQGRAVAESQPEQAEQAEAVAQEPEQPEQETSTVSEPSEDDQLADWAKSKGLALDSDNAKKAAKMAREAERAMHQKAQRASELEKNLSTQSDEVAEEIAETTGQDPELLKRLQRVEVRDSVRDFFDRRPEARAIEQDMIEELKTRPHLAGDLDALYAVVSSKDLDKVKSAGGKEALERLAQNQKAAAPTGSAVNAAQTGTQTITPENVDRLVAQHDLKWFEDNREHINRAMAGQTN